MTKEMKEQITSLVENTKVAYVSSMDENGYPTIKAMLSLYIMICLPIISQQITLIAEHSSF